MSVALGDLTLPKGSLIKCSNPYCDETIGRLAEPVVPGVSNKLVMEANSGQGARIDHAPRCKSCNFKYVVSEHDLMRIHTARGWFPNDEQMHESHRN